MQVNDLGIQAGGCKTPPGPNDWTTELVEEVLLEIPVLLSLAGLLATVAGWAALVFSTESLRLPVGAAAAFVGVLLGTAGAWRAQRRPQRSFAIFVLLGAGAAIVWSAVRAFVWT
jgi:hypothetical protein